MNSEDKNMDREVSNFNVRLRTIKIRELIVGIIIAAIACGITMAIFPQIAENDDLMMIVLLTFVLLFFAWCLKGTTGVSTNVENVLLKDNRKEILYVMIINLIFAHIFLLLMVLLDMLLGMTDPTWVSGIDIDSVDLTPSAFMFSAIASIIFAPILEELIFRGVLFNRLKIRVGIVPAMILSSFLFAIGHDFGGIVSAFLFGICMCILYLKTDNIFITMSVHFLNNLLATFLEVVNSDALFVHPPGLFILAIAVAIATVLLIKYIFEETSKLRKAYS